MSESIDENTVDHVVATIHHNTGDPLPPVISEGQLRLHLVAHGKLTPSDVRSALERATETGRIVAEEDGYRIANEEQ